MRSVAEAFSHFFPDEDPDIAEPDLGSQPWFEYVAFPIGQKGAKRLEKLLTGSDGSMRITHRTTEPTTCPYSTT